MDFFEDRIFEFERIGLLGYNHYDGAELVEVKRIIQKVPLGNFGKCINDEKHWR